MNVEIGPRLRRLQPEVIERLMQSIRDQGLLHPIIVRPDGDGRYILAAGRHRLEAVRRLGQDKIGAEIRTDWDADEAALAEIDENLARANLSPAEQALHLGEREKLYLKLHPQAKHGGAPGAGRGKRRKDDNVSSFSADAASVTGQSKRTVQRSTRRSKKIKKTVLEKVIGTSVDEGKQLDALAHLSEKQQEDIADRAEAGEKISVAHEVKRARRADREQQELAQRNGRGLEAPNLSILSVADSKADPPACTLAGRTKSPPPARETGLPSSASPETPARFIIEIPRILIHKLIFWYCELRYSERDDIVAVLAALARRGCRPTITETPEGEKVLSF